MLYLVFIFMAVGAIIAGVARWLKKRGVDVSSQSKEEEKEIEVFVVMDGTNKRQLIYDPSWGKRTQTDYNKKSPYCGQEYVRYLDDLGDYWRSYDGGKTFVKEYGFNNDIVVG